MGLFGTAGGIAGGVGGGMLGAPLGPVGVIGGGMIGSYVGGKIGGMLDDQGNPVGEQSVPGFTPIEYGHTGTDYKGERAAADARKGPAFDWSQEKADYERQLQARQRQEALGQRLEDAMNGQVPSVAQMQLQQGLQSSTQQALNVAASARGGAGAGVAAQAAAQRAAATQGQAVNAQASQLRAQEMTQARQEAGALYNAMRAGDFQARGQDVGKQQLITGTELQSRQLNDARSMGLLHSSIQEQQAAMQAAGQNANLQMQGQVAVLNANSAAQQAAAARSAGLMGGMIGAGGQVLGAGVSSGWFKGGGAGSPGGYGAGGGGYYGADSYGAGGINNPGF